MSKHTRHILFFLIILLFVLYFPFEYEKNRTTAFNDNFLLGKTYEVIDPKSHKPKVELVFSKKYLIYNSVKVNERGMYTEVHYETYKKDGHNYFNLKRHGQNYFENNKLVVPDNLIFKITHNDNYIVLTLQNNPYPKIGSDKIILIRKEDK